MSILNVNKINPVGGGSTITIAGIASVTNNISVGNSVTAGSFVGPIEGAVTGNVTGNVTGTSSGLSGNPSINTTGIVTATSFVPTVGQLSHRNIIINGAFQVAQRGTSHGSSGYRTVDRFQFSGAGLNASITTAQVDVASGTTPYTSGFRKAYKLTNGAQTGPDAGDTMVFLYRVEAQDLANSGWNYTSSSSYVTFSYWVKSSVAQNFFVTLKSGDGTPQKYATETGSLTADTWTKITKTIPGASNVQFDNDNGEGLEIEWSIFRGTNQTGSMSLNAWAANNNSVRTPDQTSTFYTTNGATFEITGVQLEVGPVATPFEHRSFGDELRRCERYYQKKDNYPNQPYGVGNIDGANQGQLHVTLITSMRQKPTLETTGSAGDYGLRVRSTQTCTGVPVMPSLTASTDSVFLEIPRASHGFTDGQACFCVAINSNSFLAFNAEL